MTTDPSALHSPFSGHTLTVKRSTVLKVKRARLTIVEGADRGQEKEFDERIRIGARPVADWVLRDNKISGLHAEIIVGNEIVLRDLNSKNGCYLRGVRVMEAVVAPGDLIELGDSKIRVVAIGNGQDIPLYPEDQFHGIVGSSAAIRALCARVELVAKSDASVLIHGETGSGKECVAEAVHDASDRSSRPLVVVDCGALPENLMEAELFGYLKGAFTGAVSARVGAFEQAHGGTLFLDEIGELPLRLQPKLLRALESGQIRRLGADRIVTVDVRIIAATNRDLAYEVTKGRFREDLYHRIAVVPLKVPALRDRLEDLPLLAAHLLQSLGIKPETCLTKELLENMSRHDWPGNVRELRNTLERIAILQLPFAQPQDEASAQETPLRIAKQHLIDEFEKNYLSALLRKCNGNVSEVARRAGIDRMSVHRIMQKVGLKRR